MLLMSMTCLRPSILAACLVLGACAGDSQEKTVSDGSPQYAVGAGATAEPGSGQDDRGSAEQPDPAADSATAPDSEIIITVPTSEISTGSGSFINYAAAQRNAVRKQPGGGDIVLNFEKTDIHEVINTILGEMLGANYVVDPAVSGTVTLATSQPMARADLLPTLEAMLRVNGAVVQEADGIYSVVPAAKALTGSMSPQVKLSGDLGYQLLVVPLRYIGVTEMQSILQPLLPESSIVKVDTTRNHLLIAGTKAELEQARATIDVFDVDQMRGKSIGLFRLQNAEANDVRDELSEIMGADSDGPLANMLRFITINRMNALIVVSTQSQYLDDAKSWIERLDRAGDAAGENMYVYPVQNGRAENLAGLLTQLFNASGGATGSYGSRGSGLLSPSPVTPVRAGSDQGAPQVASTQASTRSVTGAAGDMSGAVTIIADSENNALLIMAGRADYEKIRSAIRRLDVMPLQVLVEATILEVTLTDELSYGLQWFFKNGIGDSKQGVGELFPLPVDPSFSYTVTDSSANIRAVLNLLAADARLDIISSPSLMVLDNRTATIKVGDQVPIRTSETTSLATSGTDPLVTSTIQYRDTGVLLEVTPRVNPGGMVVLDITQDVNDVDQTTTSDIDSPTIIQRRIMTSVAVQSGETVVLGGLIRNNKSESEAGVPGLRHVPGVGRLFSSKTTTNTRTELLVLITPTAISNVEEAKKTTEEMKRKLDGIDFGA
jgi:general secretion pathway protein D